MIDVVRVVSEWVAVLSGAGMVIAQVPGVPDDFKTWPVTAILGLITLVALGCLVLVLKISAKSTLETARALGKMSVQEEERGRRMDELNQKLGATNDIMRDTVTNLRARPCLWDTESQKKRRTQEIQGM